jgi:hypothetical protein
MTMCDCKLKNAIIDTLLVQLRGFYGWKGMDLAPTIDAWIDMSMDMADNIEQRMLELSELEIQAKAIHLRREIVDAS